MPDMHTAGCHAAGRAVPCADGGGCDGKGRDQKGGR